MLKRTLGLASLTFIASLSIVSAQSGATIPESKKQLINDLLKVMRVQEQFTQIMDSSLQAQEQMYPQMFEASIDSLAGISAADKKAMKARQAESAATFARKFRERLPQVIDYQQYIDEGVVPIYARFYDEDNLRDLIAFYNTPTGQKVITSLPALTAESQNAAITILLPKILPLVKEIVDEEVRAAAPRRSGRQE